MFLASLCHLVWMHDGIWWVEGGQEWFMHASLKAFTLSPSYSLLSASCRCRACREDSPDRGSLASWLCGGPPAKHPPGTVRWTTKKKSIVWSHCSVGVVRAAGLPQHSAHDALAHSRSWTEFSWSQRGYWTTRQRNQGFHGIGERWKHLIPIRNTWNGSWIFIYKVKRGRRETKKLWQLLQDHIGIGLQTWLCHNLRVWPGPCCSAILGLRCSLG